MKEIIRKFKDCKTQLCQLLFIVLALFLPIISNVKSVINTESKNISSNIIVNIIYYFLSKLGNLGIGIFIAGIVIWTIKKMNKKKTLNNGNIYHDHSYLWFWLCSNILGYGKCNLVLVPIYMQFKLIINDVFNEFIVTNNISKEKTSPKIMHINCNNKDFLEYNLILEDTYSINDFQIPPEKKQLPTIKVINSETKNEGVRRYNPNFVESVVKEIRALPKGVLINIFATTHAQHNYEIAKQSLTLADRGNVDRVFIYQQEKDKDRKFTKEYKVI